MGIYSSLHQRLVHPWAKRWALNEPDYSFVRRVPDKKVPPIPRILHHFGIKATVQGIWALIALMPISGGLWPAWLAVGASVWFMFAFKNWRKRPINILDWICDTTLQVFWPVLYLNGWTLLPMGLIYLAMMPYATP